MFVQESGESLEGRVFVKKFLEAASLQPVPDQAGQQSEAALDTEHQPRPASQWEVRWEDVVGSFLVVHRASDVL